MTVAGVKRLTPNYGLKIPVFDTPLWGRYIEQNLDVIDSALFAATGMSGVVGIWTNNMQYLASDRAVDGVDGSMWRANVTHTSPATGTMAADRAANPGKWDLVSSSAQFVGNWQPATNYNTNEFLVSGLRYGVVTREFTSSSSYNTDVTNNNIVTLIDLTVPTADINADVAAADASAVAANASQVLANKWATNPEDVVVSGGLYSAFHWAQKAMDTVGSLLIDWNNVTNKPATFPPAAHDHTRIISVTPDVAWRIRALNDPAGFQTRMVFNTKADGTGTDVALIDVAGTFSSLSGNYSFNAYNSGATWRPLATGYIGILGFISSTGLFTIYNTAASYTAGANATLQSALTLDKAGNLGVLGNITSSGSLTVSTTMTAAGAATAIAFNAGAFSASGLTYGFTNDFGGAYTKRQSVAGSSGQVQAYYTTSGACGSINLSAATTAFTTTSDERIKSFNGNYDPAEAIAIIRADPVRKWTWTVGEGGDAIGWGAQTSYSINPDLAVPPSNLSKDGDDRWGIDYGKRTPYLWAALSAALDKIDALEARILALEAPQ